MVAFSKWAELSLVTNCRLGRIVACDELSLGTNCRLGRIVAWDELSLGTNCRLGRIVAWDELSLGTNCRLGRIVAWDEGSFSFPSPHTFERKQTQHEGLYLTISFNISSNKSFPLFCCLHSIRVVFRLNKTLFTHFDNDYVRIKCLLMTQNRKLLISSSKMRNYIGKKCEQSFYLNPKLSP